MSWVRISDKIELQATKNAKGSNKKFKYEVKENDMTIVLTQLNTSPTESGAKSELHSFIKKSISDDVAPKMLDDKIREIKNTLEESVVDEDNIKNNEAQRKESSYLKQIEDKYVDLYSSFNAYCEKYELSPLGLIVSVAHCLGVGNPREIVRAFIGYFQTISGFKGTNVIATGNATSGKSFTLETALSMIPEENIIYGVKSVAYFFRKYTGLDLTGKIFYIGDLGGDNDSVNTLEFRDVLKQLSTDGKVEKGVVDTDDMEGMDMTVTGYPALSYTSANEDILNEQEKSRSVVLSPTPVDTGKLMVYNTVMESPGVYWRDVAEVDSVRESVKGLVYKFNLDDFDFFNPYIFCIEELIKGNDDFNRKIQEFNATLKIISILNKPAKLMHTIYYDDDYEVKETPVILATKRDNINALNVFDSANLLPDEIRFANGILDNYKVFNIGLLDEDRLFEDQVIEWLNEEYLDQAIGGEDGYLHTSYEDFRPYWFTVRSLKQAHRRKKWFRKSKNYVGERINKLVEEGILCILGKDSQNHNHNVYIINHEYLNNKSVEDKLPSFKQEEIDRGTSLFCKLFPEQIGEYEEFLSDDKEVETSSIFESVKPLKPDLPFLEDSYVDL